MRASFLQALLLLGAAGTAAAVFALVAAPHGASEPRSAPLRMPVETTRAVVDVRPSPGRPESSPVPVVRSPATPAVVPKPAAAARPKPAAPALRPRARVRVVTIPGVVLTRVAPAPAPAQLIRVTPKQPAASTRELAAVDPPPSEPLPEADPMHDNRPPRWHPHE